MRHAAPVLLFCLSCVGAPAVLPDETGAVRAVPMATCRQIGAWNNPCFPAPAEIGSLPIHPCYDRRRGRCGGAGQRGMCYLDPIPDGRPCSSGEGLCHDGRCLPG